MNTNKKMAKYVQDKKLTGKNSLMTIAKNAIGGTSVGGDSAGLIKELALLGITAVIDSKLNLIIKEDVTIESVSVKVTAEEEPIPADNLGDLIKGSQYSQKELASRLGVSKSTIYRAAKNPKKYPEVAAKICELLGVSLVKTDTTLTEVKEKAEVKEVVVEVKAVYDDKKVKAVITENSNLRKFLVEITTDVTNLSQKINDFMLTLK